MQIEKIIHPIRALGPGERLGIWTLGCVRRCPGCSNPETHEPDPTAEISVRQILSEYDLSALDGATVTGGEPFMQAGELLKLVRALRAGGVRDILVYTGYTVDELRAMKDPAVDEVLGLIAVLIDGPFIEERHTGHRLKGSDNQNIIYIDREYEPIYEAYIAEEQKFDIIRLANGEIHFIGIPPKNYRELYPEYIKAIHTDTDR